MNFVHVKQHLMRIQKDGEAKEYFRFSRNKEKKNTKRADFPSAVFILVLKFWKCHWRFH